MDQFTLTFTRLELLALGACFEAACLGPTAPGINADLQPDAGTAMVKIEAALFKNE